MIIEKIFKLLDVDEDERISLNDLKRFQIKNKTVNLSWLEGIVQGGANL